MSPSRSAAFRILLAVANQRGNSDALLHSAQVTALSAEDRKLATALVMGVLRWQIALDAAIREHLMRPDVSLPIEASIAMRLGVFQLKLLERVPVHAAIHESVELVKDGAAPHTSGLVNAVLRKIAGTGLLPGQALAERAHPEWLLGRWRMNYGAAAMETICRYDQSVPPVSLRITNASAEERLLEEGVELRSGSFLRDARVVERGSVWESTPFKDGGVRVQDEGSQLVAELAGSGNEILDCCAAPGGKTAILAENNPEAAVLACDSSSERLRTMKRLLGKSSLSRRITYRHLDAKEFANDLERRFDLVLCDVPCSGTGTLARNPEIRHRLGVADVREQQERQKKILENALRTVTPGGRLVYSTCSLEPEENEAVVGSALAANKEFVHIDIRERLAEMATSGRLHEEAAKELMKTAVRDSSLHLLPGTFGCDGFFVAIVARAG